MSTVITIREIKTQDVQHINNYWQNSTTDHLVGMGVDLNKLHILNGLPEALAQQIITPYSQKKAYAMIGVLNEQAIGHCNVNRIQFGKEAYMHLHLWESNQRQKGLGSQMVKLAIPYFFKNLKLEVLFCEPYALNPGPNKTLEKAGFEFVKNYVTIPGSLNIEQEVNRWKMTFENYQKLF